MRVSKSLKKCSTNNGEIPFLLYFLAFEFFKETVGFTIRYMCYYRHVGARRGGGKVK